MFIGTVLDPEIGHVYLSQIPNSNDVSRCNDTVCVCVCVCVCYLLSEGNPS